MRKGRKGGFLLGLMGDAATTFTVILFVITFTMIMGALKVFFDKYPMSDLFWFIGAILSLLTVPVVIIFVLLREGWTLCVSAVILGNIVAFDVPCHRVGVRLLGFSGSAFFKKGVNCLNSYLLGSPAKTRFRS